MYRYVYKDELYTAYAFTQVKRVFVFYRPMAHDETGHSELSHFFKTLLKVARPLTDSK